MVRHLPGESIVYEVKVGSGGVVSPVRSNLSSPVQTRVIPKPISPRFELIKESPKQKVSAVRDMSKVMSLGDEAEKRG